MNAIDKTGYPNNLVIDVGAANQPTNLAKVLT
jgi:hypothetical protein